MRIPPNRQKSELCINSQTQPFLWLCLTYGIIAIVNRFVLGSWEVCLFRMLTGFPCPGCGLTHAAIALLRGQFHESARYHLFLIPSLLIVLSHFLPRNNKFPAVQIWLYRRHRWLCWGYIAVFLGYYFLRCLLLFPGEYPMCYKPGNYLRMAKIAVSKIVGLF